MATKAEIIERLSQCGGLSYQGWVELLDSIYFDGEVGNIYQPIIGTVLPTPEGDVDKFSIVPAGTYTFPGQEPLIVAPNNIGILNWDSQSETWSLGDPIEVTEPDLSGLATKDDVAPVKETTVTSKNFIDKTKLTKGAWNYLNGTKSDSVNWLSTPIFDIPEGIASFTLQGHSVISDTAAIAVFFTENNVFISAKMGGGVGVSDTVLLRSNFPANAKRWAFNLGNSVDIGLNPTNNPIANRIMLRNTASDSTYEPYGYLLDANKVSGLPPLAASKAVVDSIDLRVSEQESMANILLQDYNTHYKFNGTSSLYNLPKTYRLINNGDFVEIESRDEGTTIEQELSLLGVFDPSSSVFGYYKSGQMWLRERKISPSDPSPAFLQFNSLPQLNVFRVIRLTINNGKYELFIDGELKSNTNSVTNGIDINVVGNAYQPVAKFKGSVKKLHIHKSAFDSTPAEDLEVNDFTVSGGVDVEKAYEKKSDSPISFPEGFYEFNPTGYSGQPGFIAYTKRRGTNNTYIGFEIAREYNMNPLIYQDYWRIKGASDYIYDGVDMIPTSNLTMTSPESEFVFKEKGKYDFTGGYHGDELVVEITPFVNGIPLSNLTQPIPLTQGDIFEYMEKSTMHETVSSAAPTTPIPGNPVIANHIKITTISDSGFRTRNIITPVRDIEVDPLYVYLFCIAKDQALVGRNELMQSASFVGDSTMKLTSDIARDFYGNGATRSCFTTGSFLAPQSAVAHATYLMVHDRAADTKPYLSVGMGEDVFILEAGETYIVESEVRFATKE